MNNHDIKNCCQVKLSRAFKTVLPAYQDMPVIQSTVRQTTYAQSQYLHSSENFFIPLKRTTVLQVDED